MTARRVRPARPTATCTTCRQPMTVYEAGQTTHPNCDPDYGTAAHGGDRRHRQLRLIEGGDQRVAP